LASAKLAFVQSAKPVQKYIFESEDSFCSVNINQIIAMDDREAKRRKLDHDGASRTAEFICTAQDLQDSLSFRQNLSPEAKQGR